jgi:hypothetical protein
MLCKIWGVHGGDYEECRLLARYAVWLLLEPQNHKALHPKRQQSSWRLLVNNWETGLKSTHLILKTGGGGAHYMSKHGSWYHQYATAETGRSACKLTGAKVCTATISRGCRDSLSVHWAPIHPGGQRQRPSLRRHLPSLRHLQCWLQFMPYVPTGQAMEQFLPVQPGRHWHVPEEISAQNFADYQCS